MNFPEVMHWLNQTRLRRPSLAARRLALLVPATILLFSVLWGAAVFGAVHPSFLGDETPEQRYWKKFREREGRQKGSEEQLQREQREQAQASLADVIQAGAAVQEELIVAQDGPPPVHQPSIFEGKGEYVQLSLAGLLVAVLTAITLIRHKREAEIRALAGNYLSDGTEAARMKMPEFFALPATPNWCAEVDRDSEEFKSAPTKNPVQEFFAQAPGYLTAMQKALQEAGHIGEGTDVAKALAELRKQLAMVKSAADVWELRPVWQVSSALELLVTRLTEKTQEATPSALRTVASAIDLLHTLCVPGVRPDLIIHPPLEVLAVDDDPLCLRALVFALQKAALKPDVAENGQEALTLATGKVYDVIFLDINMPKMDGLTACEKIRETHTNAQTPVVFVTVRSDFQTRAASILKGGNELIGKPFLIFELTVKAMIFAVRKRLQLQESANRQAQGASFSPGTVATGTVSSSPVTVVLPAAAEERPLFPPPVESVTDVPDAGGTNVAIDLDGDLFAKVPEFLATTRRMLEEAGATSDLWKRQEILGKIYIRIHALADKTKLSDLAFATRTSTALESLLKRLHQNPKSVSPSTLNTISNALNVLDRLCVRGVEQKLAHHPPIKILVVEDEALARRAIVGALQLAFEKPDSANDGVEALNLAAQKTYDVIFSDIEMPLVDGFGLCTRIREGGPNQNTPVVFITSHIGFEVRAQAEQSGGSDFIAKPFLPIEITVKALTFALEGRLRKINAGPVLVSPPAVAHAAEPNPPLLLPAVNS